MNYVLTFLFATRNFVTETEVLGNIYCRKEGTCDTWNFCSEIYGERKLLYLLLLSYIYRGSDLLILCWKFYVQRIDIFATQRMICLLIV